jgi:hypothetical protein
MISMRGANPKSNCDLSPRKQNGLEKMRLGKNDCILCIGNVICYHFFTHIIFLSQIMHYILYKTQNLFKSEYLD